MVFYRNTQKVVIPVVPLILSATTISLSSDSEKVFAVKLALNQRQEIRAQDIKKDNDLYLDGHKYNKKNILSFTEWQDSEKTQGRSIQTQTINDKRRFLQYCCENQKLPSLSNMQYINNMTYDFWMYAARDENNRPKFRDGMSNSEYSRIQKQRDTYTNGFNGILDCRAEYEKQRNQTETVMVKESQLKLMKEIDDKQKNERIIYDGVKAALESQGMQTQENLEALEKKANDRTQEFRDEKCIQFLRSQIKEQLSSKGNEKVQVLKTANYWRASGIQIRVLDCMIENGHELGLDFYKELKSMEIFDETLKYDQEQPIPSLQQTLNRLQEEEIEQENRVGGLLQLRLGQIGLPQFENNFLDWE